MNKVNRPLGFFRSVCALHDSSAVIKIAHLADATPARAAPRETHALEPPEFAARRAPRHVHGPARVFRRTARRGYARRRV